MYRLRIYINPQNGVGPAALQTDRKHGTSIEGLAFYVKLEKEIKRFRSRVANTLGLRERKAQNGKPNLQG